MRIELDPAEVKVIEVILQETGAPPAPRTLILKVGSCLISSERNFPLDLEEEELWFLREKVSLFAQLEGRNVGLTLKRKVYQALLELDTIRQVGTIEASTEEPKRTKEGEEAKRGD